MRHHSTCKNDIKPTLNNDKKVPAKRVDGLLLKIIENAI